jgi:Cft2 family RNA processing exonuclease
MQVLFLGGASGVGASCLALEIAGQWIVIDAGIRLDRHADPLPDLAALQDRSLAAIFITHAHADHIGALPLLHQAFPTVPIYTSRATALLMEIMLADALTIMERRAVEEMELPLYPPALVASLFQRLRPLPVGDPVQLPSLAGITVYASRAGHIAGAISLGLHSEEGAIVVSGDLSLTPQRTVLGAVPPPLERPDLLVLESTYGARLHPNRQAEELRLAQAVAAGIAGGGHVLIPAFGLGRGQEVLLA